MALDNAEITLRCPKCKREFREKIGRLKNNPNIPCSGCGAAAIWRTQVEKDNEGQ
jgi:DNA-directed RNA polymerase subunit RPC12/RpoP